MKIAVAGTGYVGLSVALLLSQHNEVHALDIIPAKVELLNNGKSPIVDPVITDFLRGTHLASVRSIFTPPSTRRKRTRMPISL